MTLLLVEELRRKLATESQFAVTWEYFLDHFAEKPAFLERGSWAVRDPILRCIGECYAKANPKATQVAIDGFCPKEVPEFKMIHGAFRIGEHWGGVLYFQDLDMGLICFTQANGKVMYARFHVKPEAMAATRAARAAAN